MKLRSKYENFVTKYMITSGAVCQLGNETLARFLLERIGCPSS